MKPIDEDELIKLSKTKNFKRKIFEDKKQNNLRGQKIQENMYEHITSNFRKDEIDKINDVYYNRGGGSAATGGYGEGPNFESSENHKEKVLNFIKSKKMKKTDIDIDIEDKKLLRKIKLSKDIRKIEDKFDVKNADFKGRTNVMRKKDEDFNKMNKDRQEGDVDELKHLVVDSIKEFKQSKGYFINNQKK